MNNCPVCDTELKNTYRDTLDGWCIMEETWECPAGHYMRMFETGYTTIIVRGVEALSYGYSTPPSKLEERLYSARIAVARLLYLLETFRKRKVKTP